MTARLVQAVGTGIFIPLMMNAILEMVPSHRLGTFLAIGNGMIALGPASAPMVTGVMVDAWGWRSVFIVPLVVSVLIGCWGATVPSRMPMPHGPDARFSPRGMVESRGFAGAAVLVVTTMSVYFSLNVTVPLFLGEQVHWESTVAGFCMGPLVVAYALASLAGGRMLDRKGPRPLLPGGLGVAVAGSLLMMAAGLTASVPLVLAGALVVFVGCGMTGASFQTVGLRRLPASQHAIGVTIMTMAVQLAASLGPLVSVGVMTAAQGEMGVGGASYAAAWLLNAAVCAGGAVAAWKFYRT